MALAWTLALNGILGLAGWWGSAWFVERSNRTDRAWAAAILAAAWLVIGMQGLGTFGLISREPLLAWAVIGAVLGWLVGGRRRSQALTFSTDAEPFASRLAAGLGLGVTLGAALVLGVQSLAYPVKVVSDGPIYHLYFAARWWKAAALTLVPVPFGESAATYFPANGDLWFAWLMIGWGGDRLARVGQAPALLAAGWLVMRLAASLGARRSGAIVASCWFVAVPPFLLFSFEANVDTLFTAAYLAGVYGLVRYDLGPRETRTVALAGLAFGLAWGTKPTGTVFVAPLAGLVTIALLIRRRGATAIVFLAATLIPCVYWFGSNTLRAGNPIYPAQIEIAGMTVLPGWYGPAAMTRSPYYLPPTDLAAFWDILAAVLDVRLLPVWVLALAGLWCAGRASDPRDRWVWTLAGLAMLNILLYWVAIPYRTQQRFMLHAFGLAAVPLARLLDRPWRVAAAAGLLVLHVLTPPGWPFVVPGVRPPWSLSGSIPQPQSAILPLLGALRSVDPRAGAVAGYQLAMLALGLVLSGLWLWRPRRAVLASIAPAASTLVVLAALGWHEVTAGALRRIYPADFPDYQAGWAVVEAASPHRGMRVAYAGTDIPYYLFAGGMRNDVRYVNVDAHDGWLLHDYHHEARRRGLPPTWSDTRPGWDRLAPDPDAWLANLRRAGVRLLVVARADPQRGRLNVHDNESFPIERSWADARPDLFRLLHADSRIRVYAFRAE